LHKKPYVQIFNMRPLYNLECRAAISEMQTLPGRRLDKFYELCPNEFRMDFGGTSIILSLGKCFFTTSSPPKAPEEPSTFAMLARKHFQGQKLHSISQHGTDRVFMLDFSSENRMVVEMFAGGNLFLLGKDGTIIRPYHFKQTEKKKYHQGEKYEFPPLPSFHFPPQANDWSALPQESPLSSSLSKWPIGRQYTSEALARSKISEERKPSELSDAQVDLFLKSLSFIAKNPKPLVYFAPDGRGAELSFCELSGMEKIHAEKKEFHSCNEAIGYVFSNFKSDEKAKAANAEPPALAKLKHRLSEQESALASLNVEIGEKEKLAKFAEENISQIDARMEELNSGSPSLKLSEKERVDWKKGKYYLQKN
jgi:predicted ribosome quality control (RQC) complex YloA/Tae2 family protein